MAGSDPVDPTDGGTIETPVQGPVVLVLTTQMKATLKRIATAQRAMAQAAVLGAALAVTGDWNSDAICSAPAEGSSSANAIVLGRAVHRLGAPAQHSSGLSQSPTAPAPVPSSPIAPGCPAPVIASSSGSDGGSGRNAGHDALTVTDETTSAAVEPASDMSWSLVEGPAPASAIHGVAERPD